MRADPARLRVCARIVWLTPDPAPSLRKKAQHGPLYGGIVMVIPQLCFVAVGRSRSRERGFTLIELLVVISIVMLLLAMLVPSLGGARDQSKTAHCLARLKELGWATATYADSYGGFLPPAELAVRAHAGTARLADEENLATHYGWAELLYEYVYKGASVTAYARYPVQRNHDDRYPKFATCRAARPQADHAGHYRVYLPGWSLNSYGLDRDGTMTSRPNPHRPANLSDLPNHLVLMGDSEENSEAGDELPPVADRCTSSGLGGEEHHPDDYACETSYIGPNHWTCDDWSGNSMINEANQTVSRFGSEFVPNRFSDRHRGGTNYLFTDFHAEHSLTLRQRLACDYDLNGVADAGPCAVEPGGCERPPPDPADGGCPGAGGVD